MAAPRREYDPKRRPNIFYKGDKASNEELDRRAEERRQKPHQDKAKNIADYVSDMAGFDMVKGGDSVSTKVEAGGKRLTNIYASDGQGNQISRGESTSMPISGTRLGKTKAMMSDKEPS